MRVAVAGASPLVRDVLEGAFRSSPDITVISTTESRSDVVLHCTTGGPDVLVSSTDLADGDLAGVLGDVLRAGVRVLVVCEAAELGTANDLLFAGASGYVVLDDGTPGDAVAAAREVAAGNAALNPAAAAAVLRLWRRSRDERPASPEPTPAPVPLPTPELSRREAEVLDGLARGLATRAIGRELDVSPKTVEAHIGRLFVKLGARNRAHALSVAQSHGLLSATSAEQS